MLSLYCCSRVLTSASKISGEKALDLKSALDLTFINEVSFFSTQLNENENANRPRWSNRQWIAETVQSNQSNISNFSNFTSKFYDKVIYDHQWRESRKPWQLNPNFESTQYWRNDLLSDSRKFPSKDIMLNLDSRPSKTVQNRSKLHLIIRCRRSLYVLPVWFDLESLT